MRCFSRMPISNVPKSLIVMNSIDTRFSRNVFEAVQKTRGTCFIGSKTTQMRLVVLNPIKNSCSFFKHYLNMWSTSDKFILRSYIYRGIKPCSNPRKFLEWGKIEPERTLKIKPMALGGFIVTKTGRVCSVTATTVTVVLIFLYFL